MRTDPVVITGAAMITALGNTVAETWNALLSGKQGIRPIRRFNAEGFACRVAAQVEEIDFASLEIDPRSARIMDLHSYLFIQCAAEAFAQARLDTAPFPPEDIGLFAGVGAADLAVDDLLPAVLSSLDEKGRFDWARFWSHGYREFYPLISLFMSNNIAVCQAAIRLRIRGENAVFSPHADAGAQAIAEGVRSLMEGRSQAALVGGVSEKISPFGLARAHLQGVLNSGSDAEDALCRPFGVQRPGTILGEGCGVLSLESRAAATARGAPYKAMITGYGSGFEAERGSSAPTSDAIAQAMMGALDNAELSPSAIDALIAHGDGTQAGDGNEIVAVERVFAAGQEKLVCFSSKGALGHLLAGAPAVDTILGLCMLSRGMIPVTGNAHPLDGKVRFHLPRSPMAAPLRRLMVNCRNYEGGCASLIIEAAR